MAGNRKGDSLFRNCLPRAVGESKIARSCCVHLKWVTGPIVCTLLRQNPIEGLIQWSSVQESAALLPQPCTLQQRTGLHRKRPRNDQGQSLSNLFQFRILRRPGNEKQDGGAKDDPHNGGLQNFTPTAELSFNASFNTINPAPSGRKPRSARRSLFCAG